MPRLCSSSADLRRGFCCEAFPAPLASVGSPSWRFSQLRFYFGGWGSCWVACWILVPRPGIQPGPPAGEAWSPDHWKARRAPHGCRFTLTLMTDRVLRQPGSSMGADAACVLFTVCLWCLAPCLAHCRYLTNDGFLLNCGEIHITCNLPS